MARVTIDDLWLKDDDDGNPPSATARRSLANARDPQKARVPEKWRSNRYGSGMRWRCRWFVVKPDGTKQSKTKAFDKLCDAEEFQAALEDDIRRGRYIDPNADQRLFRDVADQWIETKLDIKPSTLGRYQRELRVYINPTWGDKTLREITLKDLQSWVTGLQKGDYKAELPVNKKGVMRKPKPLSARSIRNIVKVVMAAVFEYAITNKWIRENLAKQVVTPKIETKDEDMVFLTVPEVELLADTAADNGRDVDGLLIRFLAYTGVRINEALALQIQDLDFKGRKARIRRTWSDDGNGKMQLGTPKNGEARTIALPGSLIAQLEKLAEDQSKSEFLFRAKRGGYIHDHNWRTRVWYPTVKAVGMEDEGVNIHSLRHTYASIAIANGADVKTLQKQLGHATASITLDIYAALWPERLNEVADAVDQARLDGIAKAKEEAEKAKAKAAAKFKKAESGIGHDELDKAA
ncbi:site-specific integrase [Bifidobacterium amazonense]|uniref:Site-specific integrase n=1 Tax=Bifidobacterium amazonense TaxID=2809027 RepID=A0ABS9VU89_9BIFI|nr:site-specific integrase [Bifidobacterium amazonense]MCH9275662.1 site-specific integrase [Bifidobacterium amazonense]